MAVATKMPPLWGGGKIGGQCTTGGDRGYEDAAPLGLFYRLSKGCGGGYEDAAPLGRWNIGWFFTTGGALSLHPKACGQ
ncbi:MAG: hypothetical protein HYZ16_04885 [Bacteroidetes bacterium]|nr:hypothetical protein [Bacteroidota bacterium]